MTSYPAARLPQPGPRPVATARPACRPRRRPFAVLAILAVLAGGLLSLAAPPPPASAAPEVPKIMLVMDASGSMAGAADDGTPKIDAAKASLTKIIETIPAEVQVGLRVFGASATPGSAEACTDSQQTAPLAAGDRKGLLDAVASYTPKGETPISYALQEAAADLGPEGQRSIILVSDGVATCAPDPCVVAAEIAAAGIDVTIDVVGLGIAGDPAAKQQLQCVAASGGGQYYDASTQQELTDSLSQLAARASSKFELDGEPVSGTPTQSGAPTITEGRWLDQVGVVGSDDAARFYRVQRQIPGSTLHVSVTVKGSEADGIQLRTADGATKATEYTPDDAAGISVATFILDPRLSTTGKGQHSMGEYVDIAVERKKLSSDFPSVPGALPIQIVVIEEPPVAATKDLPPAQEDTTKDKVTGTWTDPTNDAAFKLHKTPAVGGKSAGAAQRITTGGYDGSIAPGDVQVYQVELEYGQFLTASVDFPQQPETLSDRISDGDVRAAMYIYGPTMSRARLVFATDNGVSAGRPDEYRLKGHTSEVRYLNRLGSSDKLATLPGPYYVVVSATADKQGGTYLIPFRLNVAVKGEPYGSPFGEEDATSGSAQAGSTPVGGKGAPGDDDAGAPKWVWGAGIGAGGLALLGAAYLVYRRQSLGG